jgi:hypothetical protein
MNRTLLPWMNSVRTLGGAPDNSALQRPITLPRFARAGARR